MNRLKRIAQVLLVGLFAVALLPLGAAAAQASTETISIQVNTTTPGGVSVIGTVVARRTLGGIVDTRLTFNGMIDGAPASLAAEATERWSSDGQAMIEITNISNWEASIPQPSVITLNVSQSGPGLVAINGVPVAMDGLLAAPGSGRTTYTVTAPGQGTAQIVALPNTGMGFSPIDPLLIVGLLITPGLALVLLSSLLRRWAGHPSPGSDFLAD